VLSLLALRRQLTVQADENLTAFVELEAAIRRQSREQFVPRLMP
jgi:hypothetical protein